MPLPKNCVYPGDCLDLLERAGEGTVDLVFADPPFNIGYHYHDYDDARQSHDYLRWCRQWLQGVHRVLKPNGTFWLAIGDEYAAELKLAAQDTGFHCRSWVIWYFTFGVNCANGFSRSHTHLFHFVKDPKAFTFNRINPQIRVQSARQLVYADRRANPDGRLPDNTWVIRPQDAPLSFSPIHDTWYFPRVAGTFKEREGFHGCQMPEQLLARIIRTSSCPQDLVLDPFGGSGTTMCVAKKLGRQWMGFELSAEYTRYIQERLEKTRVGDPIDGPEDPIQSAPSTAAGKQRKKQFDPATDMAVVQAYRHAGGGYPAEFILCDKDLNEAFVTRCREGGVRGSATFCNHYLLHMRKAGKLPRCTRQPPRIPSDQMNRYGFASEVAWRLLAIDYRKTLEDILCSPEFAAEFDRLAADFGPRDLAVTSCEFRRAAVAIRKRTKPARESAAKQFGDWMGKRLARMAIEEWRSPKLAVPGVFVLRQGEAGIYAYESENIRDQLGRVLENPRWQGLAADSVTYVPNDEGFSAKYALKSVMVRRDSPLLNCRLWVSPSELPGFR